MASSYEISQMIAQQNAMFAGQNQMARSIGVPPPPLSMTGMGGAGVGAYGWGFGPRPGGYHYGPAQISGYGPGNAFAGGLISGGSSALTAGSMITGGLSMMGIGGAAMGGASAVMAPLAMAAPFMAAGAQHQGGVNTMLGGQYQFFNPMSRSGSGFSRDDAKAIGDSIRHLAHIPELMTSVEEMTRIAGRLKSTGLMQGVNTAADFQARFKEAISTIRDTAKVLGTTMEEAEQFFSQSRGAGFYGKAAQLKNAISAQFTSSVTGATVGQVLSAQQAGADMAMSFGARRGLGATAVNRIAQNIGLAVQEGRIGEGAVEDVTGIGGPEGNLALAQKMFAGMMRFGQTPAGRLAMAGMMKYENGRAVGVDEQLASRFNQGLVSVDELKRRASGLSQAEKVSFTNRQEDLIASLAGQMGPGGAYGMMRGVLADHYGTDPEATNLVMRRLTGMSAGEIDIAGGMEGVSGEGMGGIMAQLRARQNARRQQTDPRAVMERLKTRIRASTIGKLEQAGADLQNAIGKSVDSFLEDLVGTEVSTLTEERARVIAQAFGGGGGQSGQGIMKELAGMSSFRSVGEDSFKARAFSALSGEMTGNQKNAFVNELFGTANTSDQVARAMTMGGAAGKGAGSYVNQIMSQPDFAEKTSEQKMAILTKGISSNISNVLNKLSGGRRFGSMSEKQIVAMPSEALEKVMSSANLAEHEKELLRSFKAASQGSKGGNVYAQMAAASHGAAADVLKDLAAGGSISLTDLSTQTKAAQAHLVSTVGETAAGYIASGPAAASAFEKVLMDQELLDAAAGGDEGKFRALAKAKKLGLSEKDLGSVQQAVRSFTASGSRDKFGAIGASRAFSNVANALAAGEGLRNASSFGSSLIKTATGSRAVGQAKLGEALLSLSASRGATREGFVKAFGEYMQGFEGLSDADMKEAIEAGGTPASIASQSLALAGRYAGKTLTSKQAMSVFGIDLDTLNAGGFQSGKVLSKEQALQYAARGGAMRTAGAAMGMDKNTGAPPKATLEDTLLKMNQTQENLVRVLAVLSGNKELISQFQKPVRENGSAGPSGETQPQQPTPSYGPGLRKH